MARPRLKATKAADITILLAGLFTVASRPRYDQDKPVRVMTPQRPVTTTDGIPQT